MAASVPLVAAVFIAAFLTHVVLEAVVGALVETTGVLAGGDPDAADDSDDGPGDDEGTPA